MARKKKEEFAIQSYESSRTICTELQVRPQLITSPSIGLLKTSASLTDVIKKVNELIEAK